MRLLEWDAYVLKHEMGLDRLPTDEEVAEFVAEKISDLLGTLSRKNPEALAEHAEAAADKYVVERNSEIKARKRKKEHEREINDIKVQELKEQIEANLQDDPALAEKAKLPYFVHRIHRCRLHTLYPELRPEACGVDGCYSTVHFEGDTNEVPGEVFSVPALGIVAEDINANQN